MIFVEHCAGCGRRGRVLCTTCRFALLGPAPTSPTGVVAAVAFRGRARDVVLGLKYGNRRAVTRHLAGLLVNRLVDGGVEADVVTWAPTSEVRRRRRGFDQAELIAKVVGRQLGIPVRRLLRRDDDVHQTGLGRAERLAQVRFRAKPIVAGARVIVVDDVVTTGATLRHAAGALRHAGAGSVVRAAVAATPDGRATGTLIEGPWAAIAGAGAAGAAGDESARALHPTALAGRRGVPRSA